MENLAFATISLSLQFQELKLSSVVCVLKKSFLGSGEREREGEQVLLTLTLGVSVNTPKPQVANPFYHLVIFCSSKYILGASNKMKKGASVS
jgi:hypothetical protein